MRRIIAFHVVFGAYGFWLPNDPRGSWSEYVYGKQLRQFGPATKVSTSHSLAHNPHDAQQRLAAKDALKFPPVRLIGIQALAVSRGFHKVVTDTLLQIYACAIMPDHVHLVFGTHFRTAESLVNQLKSCATKQLTAEGLHPFSGQHSPWRGIFGTFFSIRTTTFIERFITLNKIRFETVSNRKTGRLSFLSNKFRPRLAASPVRLTG